MKKIIALVLFATMLFAMVPGASAADDNAFSAGILGIGETLGDWYAAQKSDGVAGKGLDKAFVIGFGDGISVKVTESAAGKYGQPGSTITVALSGSYSDAQNYYYSTYANSVNYNVWGKAVKVPYYVEKVNGGSPITNDALLDGYKNLNYLLFTDVSGSYIVYYIDYVLTEEDNSTGETHYISYSNNLSRVAIKITWDNTDNNTAKAGGPYPSLKVVGYDSTASQYQNFTAAYTKEMSYDADKKVDKPGRMVFSIAAMAKADRNKIWAAAYPLDGISDTERLRTSGWNEDDARDAVRALERLMDSLDSWDVANGGITIRYYVWNNGSRVYSDVNSTLYNQLRHSRTRYVELTVSGKVYTYSSEDDTMDVRLKAIDSKGVPYPAGTVIAVGKVNGDWLDYYKNYYQWDDFLGKSNKYVALNGDPTYVIDQQNCFVFTVDGIAAFAMAAGIYRDTGYTDGSYAFDETSYYAGTIADDDVLVYTKRIIKDIQLIFTNGKTIENIVFEVYFQNVDRSNSSVTIIGDNEIEILVGETINLPYYFSDAYAMTKDLKTVWTAVDTKIVSVTDKNNGAIKGIKAGKTYVYCVDASGAAQIFVVNVVTEKTPEIVVAPVAYKTYVVTASNLNVRNEASTATSKSIVGKLPRGTEVAGIEIEGSTWVLINFNGVERYVSGKYLAEK